MLGDMFDVSITPNVEAENCGFRRLNDNLDLRPERLFKAYLLLLRVVFRSLGAIAPK